ncbi:hypothetical protein PPTG_20918 [Phytophthora nicotianae INRA-310]|uniref:Uncharacterized protein n=1 Tax=Phytophthora nicotianae (strain INRA-310) TaxID=761204 RepID=W2RCZ7_PHYN3|nr:hypothetical protein PPTG_20918 [Phytophthora nicotianae INRA-310]ETN22410.1 hypothetical protein PPTG_20918 [Phytophthora nicotianae INRA-310]
MDDIIAVRRLGFGAENLSRRELKRYGISCDLPTAGTISYKCFEHKLCSSARTPISGSRGRSSISDGAKKSTPRAHSDVFLWSQPKRNSELDNIEDSAAVNENQSIQSDHQLLHLDIVHPDDCKYKSLRQSGFDPEVMAPLLFYMKRVTSELANCINLGHNTKQACGTLKQTFPTILLLRSM